MPQLDAVPAPAAPGSIALDTVADLTPALISAIKAARFTTEGHLLPAGQDGLRCIAVLLYLRYDDHRSRWDWDRGELERCLDAGLGAGFVQRCRSRWHATHALGALTGDEAAEHLAELGVPRGAQAWVDVEGQIVGSSAEEIAYCEAWAAEVKGAGYLAGRYCGAGSHLTARQLYSLRGITAYWRSLSTSVEAQCPEPRGWCMVQVAQRPVKIGGALFDVNVTCLDHRGGRPVFLWRPEAPDSGGVDV